MTYIGILRCGVVFPADKHQAEEALKLPQNMEVEVNIKRTRNLGNHRRFFAFIQTAFNMQEIYATPEILRSVLIVKTGRFEKIVTDDKGNGVFIPHSMNFSSMEETEFKMLFKDCLDAFHTILHIAGNTINEEELYQLMEFE